MAPVRWTRTRRFIVPDGASLASVAAKLEQEGAIASADGFRLRARIFGGGAPIKAGEFLLPKGASASRILTILQGDEVHAPLRHHARRHALDHGLRTADGATAADRRRRGAGRRLGAARQL